MLQHCTIKNLRIYKYGNVLYFICIILFYKFCNCVPTAHPDIPQRTGKINSIGKFDALFFGVHFKQAQTMDPMCRMLLEHAYEAIIDAGINPKQLRGSRTGVFIGASFSESEKTWFYEKLQVNIYCNSVM